MYIVYEVNSTKRFKAFPTIGGARISAAFANKRASGRESYAVASVEDFESNVVKMVEKVNMMTGEKYMERSDTPYYCSPSSETYWSM